MSHIKVLGCLKNNHSNEDSGWLLATTNRTCSAVTQNYTLPGTMSSKPIRKPIIYYAGGKMSAENIATDPSNLITFYALCLTILEQSEILCIPKTMV